MFNPQVDGSQFKSKYKLDGKFVVLYAGALGQANDIYTILRAASRLKEQDQIRIMLLGDGKERGNLEAVVLKLGLDNVIFAGVIPKREMPEAVAGVDVCMAILQNIPMFRTTYPNKVFDYMASGKPTVIVIDGVIRQLIEESDGGVYIPPGDDAALAECLVRLSSLPKDLARMGDSARRYMENHMDRTKKMQETMNLMLGMVRE
jgi:glycosyltransferase involved in cell wall biosynthesis